MKIQITPVHTVMGNDVNVSINADQNESIATVKFECEGKSVSDPLYPPQVSYERTFPNVTGYTPGNRHVARTTVAAANGNVQVASKDWVD